MMLEINFGALSPPISVQIEKQGLEADQKDLEQWGKASTEIINLRIRGVLTDSEARKAERRLMKKIVAGVRRAPIDTTGVKG